MFVSIIWAAFRRRPFSFVCALGVTVAFTSLLGLSVPATVTVWAAACLLGLEAWHALEPRVLGWLGAREPYPDEQSSLAAALQTTHAQILLLDSDEAWLRSGLRTLVVTRGALELFEERSLAGLVAQADAIRRSRVLVGGPVVWLGSVPLLVGWYVRQLVVRLATELARTIGRALVVPELIAPSAFARWGGRLLGSIGAGLLGSALISTGQPALGLAILLAWPLTPGLRLLLAWESRRAQALADLATVDVGLGSQLLEALELFALVEPRPQPRGAWQLLSQSGRPLGARIEALRRAMTSG